MSVLHETYLPFSEDQLRLHFAAIQSDEKADPDRHLAYFREAVNREQEGLGSAKQSLQIQKDERFWTVSALMALYHDSGDPAKAFAGLMNAAGVRPPEAFYSWEAALAGELSLFFEVGLGSPETYREALRDGLNERTPIPYVKAAASRAGLRLEGATQVDALLIAPKTGAAIQFEAKVLSDCSSSVTYDVLRNQLARNIDVMLERQPGLSAPLSARQPALSAFVLLTPEVFRSRPQTRLYGWLMNEYRSDESALLRELPHREGQLDGVSTRLGWATFEDCKRIVETACPWIVDLPSRSPYLELVLPNRFQWQSFSSGSWWDQAICEARSFSCNDDGSYVGTAGGSPIWFRCVERHPGHFVHVDAAGRRFIYRLLGLTRSK